MLFFDDVDISSERCSEVLDVIRTYLSHKNIVVFVSGDYNTFAEALTLEFLQREKIPEKHYKEEFVLTSREEILSGVVKNRTILETRKQLSQEYLKKTLPPSLRFEMKALNNIDKMSFKYEFENEKSKEKEISLIQLIERKLKKDSSIVGNSLKTYHFDIFDDNPRSLINVYYYLSNLEDTDSEYQRYVNLKGFLKIILETSPKLKEYSSEIYKFIKINANKNHSDAYIDYNYLKKVFKNYLTIENNKENNLIKLNTTQIINDIINLFILGDLIYKLVGEDRNKNKNIMFASIINQFNESLLPQIQDSDITKSNNVLELLIQFVKDLNNNISSQELNNLFTIKPKQNYSAEMYYFDAFIENFAVYGGKKKKDHKVDIFFEIYKHDEKWVKNKLEFAFKISKNENSIIKQAVKRNISILGNIPGMKDFLLKNENDINSYLSNNTIKNVINLTQKNIRWVSNEFQQKSSVESFGIFGIDDYNNIVDIGIELDKDIMVKELTSTLDYVISEVYERIGNLSSKKLVLVSTTFIESINDLFDKFLQGLKRDIVYLDFLNNIQGTKVIELEKFEMFLDSLENRSYEMAPRMRRGFVEQIKDLRNNPELGNFIIENNELNFHLEIEDGETQQIIIVETMILIGITVILEYFRIESDESLNYFFNINNSLYNCKVAKESGINKIKKGKFIKVIENIQGKSNADH
ncbi:hypothetical protein Q5O89_20870 [Peribacillus frigoritolerans]|nr:hypothetical protein [Peribacillus frigoritolerans]